MKKLILLILFICFNSVYAQQNLVLNPSFENYTGTLSCFFYQPGLTFPITNWRSGSDGSTDAFSMSVATSCQMHPLNTAYAGQPPRTGNNYVGITNVLSDNQLGLNNYREYIRGRLSGNLEVGVQYQVEFYVCLSNYANAAMNNLGIKFINNSVPVYQAMDVIPFQPDGNYSGPPITDRDTWTLISFQFTPTTNDLDAFIIGNFFETSETNYQVLGGGNFLNEAYYLIDDVAVYLLEPIFEIVDEICEGDDLVLPTVSENGISGTWSPPANNQETTTYIFTPDNPNFDSIEKTIIVNPKITPLFDNIGPFCDEIPNIVLPLTSLNGISGVWSPAVNNLQTTTYIFTPNESCTKEISMTIVIDETPIFDQIDPFCDYDLNFSLPNISKNGITGTWSPEFDPYNSKTYIFTRDSEYCTQQVSMDVVVYKEFHFDLFSYCSNSQYFVEATFNDSFFPEIKTYNWKINNTSIINNSLKLNVTDYLNLLDDINFVELNIIDENNCSRSHTFQFLGKYLCKIQKGISPNQDGLNDYFDLASFGGVRLKIFNRNGIKVYSNDNYKVEWHGQSNKGNKLPSATYFYEIQTNKGEVFTGWIQLLN